MLPIILFLLLISTMDSNCIQMSGTRTFKLYTINSPNLVEISTGTVDWGSSYLPVALSGYPVGSKTPHYHNLHLYMSQHYHLQHSQSCNLSSNGKGDKLSVCFFPVVVNLYFQNNLQCCLLMTILL